MFKSVLPSLSAIEPEAQSIVQYLKQNALIDCNVNEIKAHSESLVNYLRLSKNSPLLERIVNLYSLSSAEGRILMELAEALLRTPDKKTKQAILSDKLPNHEWFSNDSFLHILSGGTLTIAGKIVYQDKTKIYKNLVQRVGNPVVLQMMQSFMKVISEQFVLAESIEKAINKTKAEQTLASFDMLGEGARDEATAQYYMDKYEHAIHQVGKNNASKNLYDGHGVSIKLSALYARYETKQKDRVWQVLLPRLQKLCLLAKSYQLNITIDAEEDARLDLSIQIILHILTSDICKDWQGFGFALQAYQRRTCQVLDIVYKEAKKLKRPFHIRLVKGAYWDAEIKIAQQKGLNYFPVYTKKIHSDIAYLTLAKKILFLTDYVYPMFATHNAQTVSAIQALASVAKVNHYEFQRLHGLGALLMQNALRNSPQKCRVYAPVGGHNSLLAYLVRRLLENGANSSFISQIHQKDLPVSCLCSNPFDYKLPVDMKNESNIRTGTKLFKTRKNSQSIDLDDPIQLTNFFNQRENFKSKQWDCVLKNEFHSCNLNSSISQNPSLKGDKVGIYYLDNEKSVQAKVKLLTNYSKTWQVYSKRHQLVANIANLYEQQMIELCSLLCREAGKTVQDAIAEVREAVDFCRYYAKQYQKVSIENKARGIVLAIAPWNFPLAIFTGQIVAALVTGNTVIAKAAEETPIIASRAIELMYQAGIPKEALVLALLNGKKTSDFLIKNGTIDMIAFTGSIKTAQMIHKNIANSNKPHIPLIAETGGINAMIVDSTALLERVVDDIIISAFQSAGQRCSALRLLYLQEEIADETLELLKGTAELLIIGNPWDIQTDIGPLINNDAQTKILHYLNNPKHHILWQAKLNSAIQDKGYFIPPTIIELTHLNDLKEEIFAPVLHIIRYKNKTIDTLIEEINTMGFGLTFAMHGRLYQAQEQWVKQIKAGNVYINRDQIGATVESQPFGGDRLSGTGPKAGGPLYINSFMKTCAFNAESQKMEGVDGEDNDYYIEPRGKILAISTSSQTNHPWIEKAKKIGNNVEILEINNIQKDTFKKLNTIPFDALMLIIKEQNDPAFKIIITSLRKKLSRQNAQIKPLITDQGMLTMLYREKHICINTTASGGNVDLLSNN